MNIIDIMSPVEIAGLPEMESASGSAVQNTNTKTSKTSNDLSLETSTDPTAPIANDPTTEQGILTKLTDLPKKCMHRVLRNLNFVDLVHVADTNKMLREHAGGVFKTKYLSAITYAAESKIENWSDDIFLSAVNAFGPKINKMSIEFNVTNPENNAIILKTVMENCWPTLGYLKLSDIPNGLVLDETFPNMHTLVFSNIHNDVHESWSSFNKYFPNLHALELRAANGIIKNETFCTHCPKLERLLCSIQPSATCASEARHFAQFLNKNSHITNLNLEEVGDKESNREFVQCVNWDELKVTNLNVNGVKVTLGKTVRFKYLQSMKTNHFDELDYTYLKRTLRELNYTIDRLEFNSYGFILQFLCLRTLKLKLTASNIKYIDMELFANNLALLVDISVLLTTCKEYTVITEGPKSMRKFIGNTFDERNKYCRRLENIKFEYPVTFLKSDALELSQHVGMYKHLRDISGWKLCYYMREQLFEKKGYRYTFGVDFTRP